VVTGVIVVALAITSVLYAQAPGGGRGIWGQQGQMTEAQRAQMREQMMERMLAFCNSECLRMNMDTGNTFIAGQDPVAFLKRFIDRVSHVHIKDVSKSLAAAVRGEKTGIAVSHCALGEGVNADNIRRCLQVLRDHGFSGVLSMECEGQGGPMIERSLQWLRRTLKELDIAVDDR